MRGTPQQCQEPADGREQTRCDHAAAPVGPSVREEPSVWPQDLLAPDGWYDSLFVRLKDDLESLEQDDHELAPDLVVLSGDIAEWGMKKEFDQALRFLEQLTELSANSPPPRDPGAG